MKRITVKKGTYYLGDPCYCFQDGNHERWMDILKSSEHLEQPYAKGGKVVVAFGTAHGDGEYHDQYGNHYPVDAGIIGLVSKSLATTDPEGAALKVKFDSPVECWEDGGILHFGPYTINTR